MELLSMRAWSAVFTEFSNATAEVSAALNEPLLFEE
jgi:hypothetical protein